MASKATEDEFVDLYNLMELPPDAEATVIRKRMNELYLEAQQNLDHRNVKKRLQYQQMYELYLPQARHLLLDPTRRAEYDRYLKAYHSGHLPPPEPVLEEEATDTSTEVSSGTSSSDVSFNFDDEVITESQAPVDPEKQAAEREQLWARWKTGLQHVLVDANGDAVAADNSAENESNEYVEYDTGEYETNEYETNEYDSGYAAAEQPAVTQFDFDGTAANVAHPPVHSPTPTAPRSPAPHSPAPSPARRDATNTAARPVAPRRPSAIDPNDIDLSDPEKVKEIERQREVRRYSLIKQAAERAGLYWGWGTGTAFFFGGCVLFYILDEYLTRTRNHPFDRSIFNALCLIGITFLSVFVGWVASSSARQRIIDELSHLTLPDLVRRTREK